MIWKHGNQGGKVGFAFYGRGRFCWLPKRCDDGYTVWLSRPWFVVVLRNPSLGMMPIHENPGAFHVDYVAGLRTNAEARLAMRIRERKARHMASLYLESEQREGRRS